MQYQTNSNETNEEVKTHCSIKTTVAFKKTSRKTYISIKLRKKVQQHRKKIGNMAFKTKVQLALKTNKSGTKQPQHNQASK